MSDLPKPPNDSIKVTYLDSRSGFYYELFLDEYYELEIGYLWRDQVGQHAEDAIIIDSIEDISRLHRRGVDEAIHQRMQRDQRLKAKKQ
jgi:hypothetical protein